MSARLEEAYALKIQGKTTQEIAQIMGVDARTISCYLSKHKHGYTIPSLKVTEAVSLRTIRPGGYKRTDIDAQEIQHNFCKELIIAKNIANECGEKLNMNRITDIITLFNKGKLRARG